ncbi:MAG TPA: heme NO-binding domain-containing protein [Candidatus Binatia bacterium]|nr:heme NO-binding domain-containing protein [Candidatus Binatia bacterium]
MYGLVNKALQDLVCSRYGEDAWETIRRNAGVDVDLFVNMEAYPDDITHKLVVAASEVLSISPDELLKSFGEHWVSYTAKAGYSDLLTLAGNNLATCLQNLDNLHTRVGLIFPRLKPPSFWCTDILDDSLVLHYRPGLHSRQGLAPFVVGLVNGLASRFKTEVEVEQTAHRSQGAEHDEFLITFTRG